FRQADGQAGDAVVETGKVVIDSAVQAGGILVVVTGHALQQQRAIFGSTCHRSGLVEARGKGNHAPARYRAVGRLEAGNATQCRGLANRAASVSAGGSWRQSCGDGRSRTAGRTAGYALRVPRVFHGAVKTGFVRRAHGELV